MAGGETCTGDRAAGEAGRGGAGGNGDPKETQDTRAAKEEERRRLLKDCEMTGRRQAQMYKQDPDFPTSQDTVAVKHGWQTLETEERRVMLDAYLDELGVKVHPVKYDSTRVFDMIERAIDASPEASKEMKTAPRHRTEFRTQMHSQTFFKSITPVDVPKDGWHITSFPSLYEGQEMVMFGLFLVLGRRYCPELANTMGVSAWAVGTMAQMELEVGIRERMVKPCVQMAHKMQHDPAWAKEKVFKRLQEEGHLIHDFSNMSYEEGKRQAEIMRKEGHKIKIVTAPCRCGAADCTCRAARKETTNKNRLCTQCQMPGANFSCSRCKTAFYCGRECQVANWKRHKLECRGASE